MKTINSLFRASLLLVLLVFGVSSALATDYKLVTSADQLVAGAKYIIADATSGSGINVISTELNSNNRRTVTGDVADGVISASDEMMVFELGGTTDAWTFTTVNYGGTNGYLYNNDTSNNRLKVGSDTNTNAFTITFANNAISSIKCNGNTSRGIMCFNGALVACYSSKSSSYKVPQLYKEVEGSGSTTVKTLSSIAVTTQPTKTEYTVGDALDLTGCVVTATYSNNSTANVTSSCTFSPANGATLATAGTQKVSVSYETKTTSFDVTVKAASDGGNSGDALTVTYNFNDANAYPSGFPTSGTNTAEVKTFTISGNDIIINAPNSYYIINSKNDASRGFFFGKTTAANGKPTDGTAYLGFPAKAGYKLTKVVVTTTAGIGGSIKMNIYDASWKSYSTELSTTAQQKSDFSFDLSNTTENTEYRLASGSSGKNLQFDRIVLTYEEAEGVEIVATPTFTPAAGTYTEAQNVTIACATEGATIYYTIDGATPTTSSTQYTAAINVAETMTIKAIAVKEGMNNSEVATAAYTINLPAVLAGEGEGTEASPYDVTRALDYIAKKQDANVEVYVEGIISDIKSIDVSKYERAQYYISKDGSKNNQLYIFNGYYLDGAAFTANDQIKVGDKVVVCGKLTEYSGTKEMDANNKLISIESSGVTPPVVDPVVTVKRAIVAEYNGVYYAATTTVESKKLKAVAVGLSDGKVVFDGEESIVWNWDEENGTLATEDGKYLAQTGSGTDIVVSESGNINWTLDDKNGLVSNSITGRAFIYRNTNVFGNYSASNVGKSDYSGKVQLLPIAEEGLTATIGFTGYATFCPSFDVNVPEGVEVYTVSALNEESVALAQYEGDKIKAGEGVILKGADKSVAGFAKTTDATAIPGNLLVGATTDKALAAGEAYLLANDGGSAAFLLCEAGTLSAGKAYLPANGANAPSLSIVIDDATAIEGLTASKPQNLTTSVYNLAGQKVGADYKGIVIVNGKKLIKK